MSVESVQLKNFFQPMYKEYENAHGHANCPYFGLPTTGTCQRSPVLGGSKLLILGQMSVCELVFFTKFLVGCSTNRMQRTKNMCVIFFGLYRCNNCEY